MMKNAALIVLIAGAAAMLLVPKVARQAADDAEDTPDYEEPGLLDQADALFQDIADMTNPPEPWEVQNMNAFLWALRVSEGTEGPNGYRTIVGGSTFDGYADHPRVLIDLPNLGIKSSAAGAYQIIRRTWDGVRGKLNLKDFSPASQDAAAVELIRQRGALADVRAGRFADAIAKCAKEWASLPGAGYGQHENTLARLQSAYTVAGGLIA